MSSHSLNEFFYPKRCHGANIEIESDSDDTLEGKESVVCKLLHCIFPCCVKSYNQSLEPISTAPQVRKPVTYKKNYNRSPCVLNVVESELKDPFKDETSVFKVLKPYYIKVNKSTKQEKQKKLQNKSTSVSDTRFKISLKNQDKLCQNCHHNQHNTIYDSSRAANHLRGSYMTRHHKATTNHTKKQLKIEPTYKYQQRFTTANFHIVTGWPNEKRHLRKLYKSKSHSSSSQGILEMLQFLHQGQTKSDPSTASSQNESSDSWGTFEIINHFGKVIDKKSIPSTSTWESNISGIDLGIDSIHTNSWEDSVYEYPSSLSGCRAFSTSTFIISSNDVV